MTANENFVKYSFPLLPVVAFFLLLSLAVMGGLPSAERINGFIIGITVLLIVTMAFGFAGWHLLSRPLPANHKALPSPMTAFDYQVFAIVTLISQVLLTIGGTWDEIWHTRYGIPFGEDFFWRPHLMLYTGFLLVIVLGAYAFYRLMKIGKGSLQQRFRADSLLGLQVLFGAFTVYALAADPVWHSLYGEDLSAWSIPHVILILIWVMSMVIGMGMQFAALRERQWSSILRISFDDIIPIMLNAMVLLMVLVMFAVQWELYTLSLHPSAGEEVLRHPDWFFPLFVVFTSTFTGILGNMTTRRVGTASLIALTSIAIRLTLVYSLDHITRSANPWLLALMPALGIDVLFAVYLRWKGHAPRWYFAALGAMLGTILGLYPLLNNLYRFPNVGLNNILPMSLALFGGALLAAWMAEKLGELLKPRAAEQVTRSNKLLFFSPLAFLLLLGAIALFILTATAPV